MKTESFVFRVRADIPVGIRCASQMDDMFEKCRFYDMSGYCPVFDQDIVNARRCDLCVKRFGVVGVGEPK